MRFPFPLRHTPFESAIQHLRDGRPGEAGYGRRIALLLTLPAFDDPIAHDVRRMATGEMYVVRTVWHRALDLSSHASHASHAKTAGIPSMLGQVELTATRQPSLWSTRVPVDADALDALLATLGDAVVPCQPCQTEPPLDATIIELTLGAELNETRYRWCGEPPAGWAPLAEFATRFLRLVDAPIVAVRR